MIHRDVNCISVPYAADFNYWPNQAAVTWVLHINTIHLGQEKFFLNKDCRLALLYYALDVTYSCIKEKEKEN